MNPSMYIKNIVQSIGIIISEIKCVYVIVNARREVIKLISNPRIPINARAVGEGINRNSRVAKQLNNRRGGH